MIVQVENVVGQIHVDPSIVQLFKVIKHVSTRIHVHGLIILALFLHNALTIHQIVIQLVKFKGKIVLQHKLLMEQVLVVHK